MSDIRDPDRDQPLPIPSSLPACHDMAVDLLYERKAHGTRKYGMPLQPDNGRSFSRDALEEAADLLVYLVGKQYEEDNPDETWLGSLCWTLMNGQDWTELTIPQPVRNMLERMDALRRGSDAWKFQ